MRETRQSGSEGGARFNPLSLPLSVILPLRGVSTLGDFKRGVEACGL